jgi:hypothetical protein
VLCFLLIASFCFTIVIVCVSAALTNLFIHSFFLSIHLLLIVGCRLVPPSLEFLGAGFVLCVSPFLGVGLGTAPIAWLQLRHRQCSHSLALALVVLPFLGVSLALVGSSASAFAVLPYFGVGLGSAPIPCRPRPWWWSFLVPWRHLGGPPQPHLGAPHETFGLASMVLLLGSLPSPWCSAQNLRPCLCSAPPRFLCISFDGMFWAYC